MTFTTRSLAKLSVQVFQALEVGAEAGFGVLVGVVEDADRPAPAAVADLTEQFEVEVALADHEDVLARLVAVADHAVEVQREQVRLHRLQERGEAVEVVVAVVEVVNDPDVGQASAPR